MKVVVRPPKDQMPQIKDIKPGTVFNWCGSAYLVVYLGGNICDVLTDTFRYAITWCVNLNNNELVFFSSGTNRATIVGEVEVNSD